MKKSTALKIKRKYYSWVQPNKHKSYSQPSNISTTLAYPSWTSRKSVPQRRKKPSLPLYIKSWRISFIPWKSAGVLKPIYFYFVLTFDGRKLWWFCMRLLYKNTFSLIEIGTSITLTGNKIFRIRLLWHSRSIFDISC